MGEHRAGRPCESLEPGGSLGGVTGTIRPADVALWNDIRGAQDDERGVSAGGDGVAPWSFVLAFGLRAITDLDIIPPGAVLVGHRLRFERALPIGTPIDIGVTVARRWDSRGRPFATLALRWSDTDGSLAEDLMTAIWPTASISAAPLPPVEPSGGTGRAVTQAQVEAYAALSGDHNPLHLDLDRARAGPFGELVVHGVIPAGIMLDEWADQQTSGHPHPDDGVVSLTFRSPLRPEEPFRIESGSADDPFDVACTAGGRVLVTLALETHDGGASR